MTLNIGRKGRSLLLLIVWGACLVRLLVAVAVAQPTTPAAVPQESLPMLRAHPLPPSLARLPSQPDQGDYFSAIQPTRFGYLVWSEFPVKIYIEPVDSSVDDSANEFDRRRAQSWVEAVTQSVREWGAYLPLTTVDTLETADIQVLRRSPPLGRPVAGGSGPRARSAETQYELFIDRPADAPAQLSHRFTIHLSPTQPFAYTIATARHELGHALGIWGHSPSQTDALYFSQVRSSPPISRHDISTLKRIYEQPTRIGWPLRADIP